MPGVLAVQIPVLAVQKDFPMRADRLLSILLLLQVHRHLTARELAQRLEVSVRTIYRDMDSLSAAGIPVLAERGINGGWLLLDNYQTNLTGLTDSEIKALFFKSPRLLADLGLDKASEAAFIKLLAALPAVYQHNAEFVRQRLYVDSAGWGRTQENVPFLPQLQEALWQDCKIRFSYQRSEGETVERTADPLGLVAKGNVWYLVAAIDGEIRTYRVSRIVSAALLPEKCVRPPDFDLSAHWTQSTAEFVANLPRYPAVLRADPAFLPRMYPWRYARIERTAPPDSDGWIQVDVTFEVEDDACGYVLSGRTHLEVLEPPALRERVLQAAQAIVELYKH
jgi:predicted DNA-binding transcriptional regulator YafY